MKDNITEYAKLGLVHQLLYPKCVTDPDYHVDTLNEFVKRDDIEALDCCIPYGQERRNQLIQNVRNCGKDVAYAMHLFPLRKISLASLDPQEQALSRLVIKDQIDMAAAIGAKGFVFPSGADIPENRPKARACFKEFCKWFCAALKPYGITALLEPFDREIDKKFLYGPIDDCVALIEELSRDFDNIGIELDVAHLPLMSEDFEYAIKTTAKYTKRVHLGNCVLQNKNNPLYGDMHPPIGIEEGEIDIPELALILRTFLETGYLEKEKRKPLLLEITPFPGKSIEYTVNDNFKRLNEAWKLV